MNVYKPEEELGMIHQRIQKEIEILKDQIEELEQYEKEYKQAINKLIGKEEN
jgi:prefoldin subunit 5